MSENPFVYSVPLCAKSKTVYGKIMAPFFSLSHRCPNRKQRTRQPTTGNDPVPPRKQGRMHAGSVTKWSGRSRRLNRREPLC